MLINKKKTKEELVSLCVEKEKGTMFAVPRQDIIRLLNLLYTEYAKGFENASTYKSRLEQIYAIISESKDLELTTDQIKVIKANAST